MLRKTFLSVSLASMISIIPATAEIEKPFLAIVNGEKIYESQIHKTHSELPQQYQQLPFDILKPMLLDRAINQQLLIVSGKKANLENDKQVKKRIKILSDRVVAETFLERNISKKVNEKAIKEDYENFLKNSEPEPLVHARHILLKTKSDALSVIKELNNGENFIELVKKRSIDKSNIEDGDLGFFKHSEMVKSFANAAFSIKPGSYSNKPIKTELGWHIIFVEEKKDGKYPSLQEAHDSLVSKLTQKTVADLIQDLRSKANIFIPKPENKNVE